MITFSCSKDEEAKESPIVGEWLALNVGENEYVNIKFQANLTFLMEQRLWRGGPMFIDSSLKGKYTLEEDTILLHENVDSRGEAIPSLTYVITFDGDHMIFSQVDGREMYVLRKI